MNNEEIESMYTPQIVSNIQGYTAAPVNNIVSVPKISREEKFQLLNIAAIITNSASPHYATIDGSHKRLMEEYQKLLSFVESW